MKIGKVFLRTGVVLLSALCLLVFQVVTNSILADTRVYAKGQFETLAPNTITLTPAIEDGTPIPTPLPTVGPGQSFEQGDENLPKIADESKVGGEQYGYARLDDDPSLFLIWSTDERGTHYLVVGENSDILTGGNDPEMGFRSLVRKRNQLRTDIDLSVANKEEHRSSGTWFRIGTVLILGGAIVCTIITGGFCGVAIAPIAAGPFWASLTQDSRARIEQNNVESLAGVLEETERNLRFQLKLGQSTESGS